MTGIEEGSGKPRSRTKYRLLMVVLLLSVGLSVQGAVVEVDSLADGFPVGECTLRAAIASVNQGQDQGGCRSAGSYGVDDRIAFEPRLTGTILMNDDYFEIEAVSLIIDGSNADITIDANGHNGIFSFRGGSLGEAEFGRVEGLMLQGGVLRSFGAELEVHDAVISGNRTSRAHDGGGIYVSDADLTVSDSEIIDNHAIGGCVAYPPPSGPVICVGGGGIGVRDGNVLLINATVSDNRAYSVRPHGGGIVVRNGDLELIDSVVTNNQLNDSQEMPEGTGLALGAGIHVSKGDVTLVGSTISDNNMNLPGRAGGLSLASGALTASNCRVTGNIANGDSATGGGLDLVDLHGVHLVSDCEISGNVVFGGGGPDDTGGAGIRTRGELDLVRSTISGNFLHAPGKGSGIRSSNHLTLVNSTISDNESWGELGAAIHITSASGPNPVELSLAHSTIHGNRLPGQLGVAGIRVLDIDGLLPVIFTADNSIISQVPDEWGVTQEACSRDLDGGAGNLATDDSCGIAYLIGGVPVAPAELALEPLADNGGFASTHALGAGSVAVNAAGDCSDDPGLDHDQRGEPRPGVGADDCDVGAYERQGVATPEADLSIAKSVLPGEAEIGHNVTFTLQAGNLGPDTATGVTVTDLLPDGYSFVSATTVTGSYDPGSGLWTIGTLAHEEFATLSIEVTVVDGEQYFNTASVTADTFDPDTSNNEDSAEVIVIEPSPPPDDFIFSDRYETGGP